MQLQAAISEKALHFHRLHDKDGGRVHQKFVCEKDSAEVTRDHVIKGYQLAKGKYVEVEPEELKKFLPESTGRIDIADFVALAAIDPIYCAHTYSVQPAKGGAAGEPREAEDSPEARREKAREGARETEERVGHSQSQCSCPCCARPSAAMLRLFNGRIARKPLVTAFLSGVLFACGLAVSGMTLPAKVLGFLDVTGAWDPSLILVMTTAIPVYALAWHFISPAQRPQMPKLKIDCTLVHGAVLLGHLRHLPVARAREPGWLGTWRAAFYVAMIAGMWLQDRIRSSRVSDQRQ